MKHECIIDGATNSGSSPFIHKITTDKNHYIYDVNSKEILSVDKNTWDIVSDVGSLTSNEIVQKHSALPQEEIFKTIKEIEATQKQGLLLSHRPKIKFSLTKQDIAKKLKNNRTLLLLYVTEACNFRCSYCVYNKLYEQYHGFSQRKMDWEIAKKAVDEFLRNSDPSDQAIAFYGGEPLLNFDLIKKTVEYVKSSELGIKTRFTITTNGSLLQGEAGEFLAENEFVIVVSLDGPANIHDRHRRTIKDEPTWNKIISNLTQFVAKFPQYKSGSRFRFSSVLIPSVNIDDLSEFYKNFNIISETTGINISFGNPFGNLNLIRKGEVVGLAKLKEAFIDNLIKGRINKHLSSTEFLVQRALFEKEMLYFHKRLNFYSNRAKLPDAFCALSICMPGVRRSLVTVNGDYLICERVAESDYFKIGNVNSGFDVDKIWNLMNSWAQYNSTECGSCWCLPTCNVGCWANISGDQTNLALAKQDACKLHKKRMHELLTSYCRILEQNPNALDYMEDIHLS